MDLRQASVLLQRANASWRVPAALIIMILGIILTLAMHSGVARSIGIGPVKPHIIVPTKAEWRKGMIFNTGCALTCCTPLNQFSLACDRPSGITV